jgi:hypothetical protein
LVVSPRASDRPVTTTNVVTSMTGAMNVGSKYSVPWPPGMSISSATAIPEPSPCARPKSSTRDRALHTAPERMPSATTIPIAR